MSVRGLVGQMFMISMGSTEPDYYVEKMIRERNIGGVLLFGYNMESEAQTRALTGALQRLSMRTEPAIPLFIAVDQEGVRSPPRPGSFRSRQPRGSARGGPRRAREIAEQMGGELLRAGVNTDLAPVVDTGSGAAIGTARTGRPAAGREDGRRGRRGLRERGVVSAAKHFPNHGPATTDSHRACPSWTTTARRCVPTCRLSRRR